MSYSVGNDLLQLIITLSVYGDIMENISHTGNLAHVMEAMHGFCEWSGERGSNKRQGGVIFSFAAYLAFNQKQEVVIRFDKMRQWQTMKLCLKIFNVFFAHNDVD